MSIQRYLLGIILSSILLTNAAVAQSDAPAQGSSPSASTVVTVSTSTAGVRFTAPAQVLQMRVALYNAAGELVFDSGLRQGNVLDWKRTDASQAMTDGSYLSVVTVKDLQGTLRQRLGVVSIEAGQLAVKRLRQEELTAAQSQALTASRQSQKIETAESEVSLSVLSEGKERSATVTAHDGENGQVTSTNGALTFRTGNVFSGTEQEQMRVTPDGRVGIGTDKPEATLDVAGTIRARGGIRFDDGTVLNSAKDAGALLVNTVDNPQPNVAGTGTTGRLTKWLDNAGTLSDSVITETATGNVGIGNTNPTTKLTVSAAAGAELRFAQGSGGITPVLSVISTPSSTTTGAAAVLGAGTGGSSFVFSDNQPFHIVKDTKTNVINNNLGNGTPLFTMLPTGSVGIGTTSPLSKLHVNGDVRLSATGSGLIFPDGSKMTTAPGGAGSTPSGNSIISSINDPATTQFISDTRISGNLARLGGANLWTGANTFGAGLSANNALITNVGNPVNAGDAVNKAYADANFIKFVPGAEQLSVGDANGTAPMINLRGGSTCCSGPGGHTPAWFKVFQNGSFVATGNLGIGVSPMQGKGYRTSWDSY
ncbi:MAG TPA: hypothetical protein VF666_03515, partial [Pyrinomonadaceae bacterium]